MRRPAQHRPGTAAPGWAHPYTGIAGRFVFYNDGGQGDGNQPAGQTPSPAQVAALAGQQQPQTPAGQQPDPNTNGPVLLDHRTGAPMTQEAFAKIMARENAKGRRAAMRELAETAGVSFTGGVSSDPDDSEVARLAQVLKDAETTRQAQLSEDQRRAEELARKEEELQTGRATLEQDRTAIAAERRALAREQALTRLGAIDVVDNKGQVTAPNLQDALAMLERDLRETPDADQAALAAAAEGLKKRRPELFGATAPQTLPPAPSGGPAGGNAPRQPAAGKDAVREAARARARAMGLRTDDAA